jgi:hypothetical protein
MFNGTGLSNYNIMTVYERNKEGTKRICWPWKGIDLFADSGYNSQKHFLMRDAEGG